MPNKTILDFLPQLEQALAYAGGTHDVADVARLIRAGEAQLWVRGDAMVVTQIDQKPRELHLVFWLVAGDLDDALPLIDEVSAWGRDQGCSKAVAVCRKGWTRVMEPHGWQQPPKLVLLERDL